MCVRPYELDIETLRESTSFLRVLLIGGCAMLPLMFRSLGCMIVAAALVAFVGYVLLFTFLSMGAYVESVIP